MWAKSREGVIWPILRGGPFRANGKLRVAANTAGKALDRKWAQNAAAGHKWPNSRSEHCVGSYSSTRTAATASWRRARINDAATATASKPRITASDRAMGILSHSEINILTPTKLKMNARAVLR